jgi:hypothetical protein
MEMRQGGQALFSPIAALWGGISLGEKYRLSSGNETEKGKKLIFSRVNFFLDRFERICYFV